MEGWADRWAPPWGWGGEYWWRQDGTCWGGNSFTRLPLYFEAAVFHFQCHYNDVIMAAMASQITSLSIVYSTVYSGADQRKHQSSTSLAVVRGIHRWPVNSPHKWPVTWKMFPFEDVIINALNFILLEDLSRYIGAWGVVKDSPRWIKNMGLICEMICG